VDHALQKIAFQPPVHVPGNFHGGCGSGAGPEYVVYELDEVPHGAAFGGHVAGQPGQVAAGEAAQDQEIVEGVQVAASADSCAFTLSFASLAMHMGP